MNRVRIGIALTCGALAVSAGSLRADVRADQKTHVEFAGMLGKIVNIFGGKAAREGVTTMVAVKGGRKATLSDTTGQIIDLNEEKIYDLDLKKKTYAVTTFAERRRKMEEERQKAEENPRKQQAASDRNQTSQAADRNDKNAPQMQIDLDVRDTGEKKTINGFDTHEVVMTITMHEKGKTLEESGGLVLTSDMWMAPKIAAMRELADFDRRYAEKMQGPMLAGASPDQMAAAMAMYPMMKDAIGRMNVESGNMDGTSVDTTVKMEAVKSASQAEQERQQQQQQSDDDRSAPGMGSLVGRFAKKMAEKRSAAQNNDPTRATIMTMTDQTLKVTTDVTAAEVGVPAGFKESR